MALELIAVLLVIVLVWLGILTYYLRRTLDHYNSLTKGISKKSLEFVMESLIRNVSSAKKDIATLITRCDTIEKNETYHIQKVGLLRFNPFKDTGGDQSFILTLCDAHDSGVIITGLYSRSGLRWYAKKIVDGKGIEHSLSEEELKTLKLAKNN